MNYIFEIRLKKSIFLAKYDRYFGKLCAHFELVLQ